MFTNLANELGHHLVDSMSFHHGKLIPSLRLARSTSLMVKSMESPCVHIQSNFFRQFIPVFLGFIHIFKNEIRTCCHLHVFESHCMLVQSYPLCLMLNSKFFRVFAGEIPFEALNIPLSHLIGYWLANRFPYYGLS